MYVFQEEDYYLNVLLIGRFKVQESQFLPQAEPLEGGVASARARHAAAINRDGSAWADAPQPQRTAKEPAASYLQIS